VSHATMSAGKTVLQPSASSSEGSISNGCTLRLADVQLFGQWWAQTSPGRHVRQPTCCLEFIYNTRPLFNM